jgi:hypothetical protein
MLCPTRCADLWSQCVYTAQQLLPVMRRLYLTATCGSVDGNTTTDYYLAPMERKNVIAHRKTNDSEAVPTDFKDRTNSMSEYSSKRSTLARLLPHSIPSYVQFLMIGLSNRLQNAFAASPEKITIPRRQQKLLTAKSKVAIKCSSYRYQLGLCRVISCLWNI